MTENTRPSNPDDAAEQGPERSDAWLSDILDDVASIQDLRSVAPDERARVADLLFLDALLERVHRQRPEEIDEKVRQVMTAIDADCLPRRRAGSLPLPLSAAAEADLPTTGRSLPASPGARLQMRRRWLVSSLTMAAGVAGVGTAWLLSGAGSATAQDTVKKAYEESWLPEDRQYRITTTFGGPVIDPIEGELFVQGGDKFVVHQPTILGTRFWLGSNGKRAWLIPSVGPVLVSSKPELLRQWIDDRDLNVPFLQITSVLSVMQDDYELAQLTDERLPGGDRTLWRRIRGTKDKQRLLFPNQIDAWVHPVTGTVGRLVLDWNVPKRAIGLKQIRFDLVGRERMPADWYDAAPHHGTNRAVLIF